MVVTYPIESSSFAQSMKASEGVQQVRSNIAKHLKTSLSCFDPSFISLRLPPPLNRAPSQVSVNVGVARRLVFGVMSWERQ